MIHGPPYKDFIKLFNFQPHGLIHSTFKRGPGFTGFDGSCGGQGFHAASLDVVCTSPTGAFSFILYRKNEPKKKKRGQKKSQWIHFYKTKIKINKEKTKGLKNFLSTLS